MLFGGAIGSGAVLIVKERLREQLEKGTLGKAFTLKRMVMVMTGERAMQRASKTGMLLFGTLTGFGLGMGWRDHQLTTSRHTYWDVAIVERYNDRSFMVQPERMQHYRWDFCAPAPFDRGEQVKFITYEQQPGCKRLEYFKRYEMEGERDAQLSTR